MYIGMPVTDEPDNSLIKQYHNCHHNSQIISNVGVSDTNASVFSFRFKHNYFSFLEDTETMNVNCQMLRLTRGT